MLWKSREYQFLALLKRKLCYSYMCNITYLVIKPGLHCAIYFTFTPNFMCWKYFDKCFMDKNLHIFDKFNKLNKSRKRVSLD